MKHSKHLSGSLLISAIVATLFTGCNEVDSPVAPSAEKNNEGNIISRSGTAPTYQFSSKTKIYNVRFTYEDGWETPDYYSSNPSYRLLGELNGDNRPDIIAIPMYQGSILQVHAGLNRTWQTSVRFQDNAHYGRVGRGRNFAAGELWGWCAADFSGDGRDELAAFSDDYNATALMRLDGECLIGNNTFGNSAGSPWVNGTHLMTTGDVNGDGKADLVAFGNGGVHVALKTSASRWSFQPSILGIRNFAIDAGGWHLDRHPRVMADVNGDGKDDIVGLGGRGVLVSLSNGDGTFGNQYCATYNISEQHDNFEHFTAGDVNGDGRDDVVAFGHGGVWVALANSSNGFDNAIYAIDDYDSYEGGWNSERHLRFVKDMNGDGKADIVGIGQGAVFVSLSKF